MSHVPRVALWNDDALILSELRSLMCRDERVFLDRDWCFTTPGRLIKWAKQTLFAMDIVILDVEHRYAEWPIARVVAELKGIWTDVSIICLAQYANASTARDAIRAGANGFLLRDDILYGVSASLVHAEQTSFIYTPSVAEMVQRHLPRKQDAKCLPCWRMYRELPPRLAEMAQLLFIRGMSPHRIAAETSLTRGTIHTFKYRVRRILKEEVTQAHYDLSALAKFTVQQWDIDKFMFHLLTSLPSTIA